LIKRRKRAIVVTLFTLCLIYVEAFNLFPERSTRLLEIPFSMFSDSDKLPSPVRTRILEHFLLPMIDASGKGR
jgi:hypothetical protein